MKKKKKEKGKGRLSPPVFTRLIRYDFVSLMAKGKRRKRCFVTVGTTKFEDLVKGMDTEVVLEALVSAGYTNLVLQIGGTIRTNGCAQTKDNNKKEQGEAEERH